MPNTTVRAAAEGLPKNMSAKDRLEFHARQFAKAAQELDPTATEWSIGEAVADEVNVGRYWLIVSRKAEKGGAA